MQQLSVYGIFATIAVFLPISETARALAVIEAVVGQFYVAVVVAVFVGMFAARRRT